MLSSKLHLAVASQLTRALDLGSLSAPLHYRKNFTLEDGTGAGQADLLFHDQRTLAPSTTDTIPLDGTLEDALGSALDFARVRALLLYADPANATFFTFRRQADLPILENTNDAVFVRPGGLFAWVAPDATGAVVTPGTGDSLTIQNGDPGNALSYDIILLGASA